jgi:hypothetical protein
MTTLTEVHSLIDQQTIAEFLPQFTVVFDNVSEQEAFEGVLPFLKQTVVFSEFAQFELGIPENQRIYGTLMFFIYVKQGTGSGAKNSVLEKIVSRFRGKQFSNGLTTLSVTASAEGARQNWNVTAVEVPFYFHNF